MSRLRKHLMITCLILSLPLLILGCGSDNPLSANEIDGVYDLKSFVATSDTGVTVTWTPPQATGRISFESDKTYAYQFSINGSVTSGSGTYTLSGGIVIFDNETTDVSGGSTLSTSVSYTGSRVTMVGTVSPPSDGLASLVIIFE